VCGRGRTRWSCVRSVGLDPGPWLQCLKAAGGQRGGVFEGCSKGDNGAGRQGLVCRSYNDGYMVPVVGTRERVAQTMMLRQRTNTSSHCCWWICCGAARKEDVCGRHQAQKETPEQVGTRAFGWRGTYRRSRLPPPDLLSLISIIAELKHLGLFILLSDPAGGHLDRNGNHCEPAGG
jgi:hypothetical protein